MFVCRKWLKLSNVRVSHRWELRRCLQDINPVLLSVVLSVCLVCNSDLKLGVNTVFSTMTMIIIIRNVVLMSTRLKQTRNNHFHLDYPLGSKEFGGKAR